MKKGADVKRTILGLALAGAAALPCGARADQAPPTLPGTRPLGMGNAFVAVAKKPIPGNLRSTLRR